MKHLALPLIFIILSACHKLVPDDSSTEMNMQDFQAAWEFVDANYPLLEYKEIDWDAVYTEYVARAEATVGDDIYQVLYDLIGELEDPHAKILTLGGTGLRPFTSPRMIRDMDAYNVTVMRSYFDDPLLLAGNNALEYQFITDDIGYVRISTFGSRLVGRHQQFETVLRYFENAKGLIVDVRENDGGSSQAFEPIVSYLIADTVFSGYQVRVDDIIEPGFVTPNEFITFTRPIVLLINGTSFSAAEVFADRFWQLDHVTLVGDTTAGGGMSIDVDPEYILPSGKGISMHLHAVFRQDSIPLEKNGVAPEIRVVQTAVDAAAGRDLQLEFAIDWLDGL